MKEGSIDLKNSEQDDEYKDYIEDMDSKNIEIESMDCDKSGSVEENSVDDSNFNYKVAETVREATNADGHHSASIDVKVSSKYNLGESIELDPEDLVRELEIAVYPNLHLYSKNRKLLVFLVKTHGKENR